MKLLILILLLALSLQAQTKRPYILEQKRFSIMSDTSGQSLNLLRLLNGFSVTDIRQAAIELDMYYTLNDSIYDTEVEYLFFPPARSTGIKVFGGGGWKSDQPTIATVFFILADSLSDSGTFMPTYSSNFYNGFKASSMIVYKNGVYTGETKLFSDMLGILDGPQTTTGGFAALGDGFILSPDLIIVLRIQARGSPIPSDGLIKPLLNWIEY